jgi:flagellar biosynthesis protein FliQ
MVDGKVRVLPPLPDEADVAVLDTVVRSLALFAIDLAVIAYVTHLFNEPDLRFLARGFVVLPILLVLAGIPTALIPGPWLSDALDIRLVTPARGEVVRAAELFQWILGPLSAAALLVSLITALYVANHSCEQGLMSLDDLSIRLFPPTLVAVSACRILLGPDVLPGLEKWCDQQGIAVNALFTGTLARLKFATPSVPEPSSESTNLRGPPRADH